MWIKKMFDTRDPDWAPQFNESETIATAAGLWIEKLMPEHFKMLDLQPSQCLQLGELSTLSDEEAEALCDQDEAWACRYDGVLVALVGIRETYPGRQGVAWAMLADKIGSAHLAVTRYARWRVSLSPLKRLEVIAIAGDVEAMIDASPRIANDPWFLCEKLSRSTAECRWAALIGFRAAHVLRNFGAASETHMLFERIGSKS
jgi:hypothetical protein